MAVGALFVLIGFQLVIRQLDSINSEARRSDRFVNASNVYQAQVTAYGSAVAAYQVCLDGVTRSDLNRGQWQTAVDVLRQSHLDDAADTLAAGPLLAAKARTTDECPVPSPLPPPPTR